MSNKHLILASLLLLLLFLDLSYSKTIPPRCHPHDKKVLLRIKKYFGNPSSLSSSFSPWDPNTDCDGWNGIQCDLQGHVTEIRIENDEDIHGPLPPFLDQLPFLTDLHFESLPNLSGPIPSSIGKLTNLTGFFIRGTNVGGPIPKFLGQLKHLQMLYLNSNKFSGPIPNFVGRFKNLNNLDLSSNQLTGPIPRDLGQLNKLVALNLTSNNLSGLLPTFDDKTFKKLAILYISFNSLSGPIPAKLGFLPNIQVIELVGNKLSGPIPKSFGRGNLYILRLSQNKLTGDASFLFEKSNTNLQYVEVAYNHLKFDFTNVDLGQNLSILNISHNMIYGSLPQRFGLLRTESVDVSYNQLCGPIPNGRRFKRFPNLFAHNKCLCGGPYPGCK